MGASMQSKLFDKLMNIELTESSKNAIWEEFGIERATIVIDSSGFSRVTKEKGILHFMQLITRMRNLFRNVMNEYGATRLRFEADNTYAEFKNMDDAFKAVLACNQALVPEKLMLLQDEPFTVCTGIGFGRLLDAEDEGVYGDEMNLASKLGEDTADSREILLTQNAYENLSAGLRQGFEIKDIVVSGVAIHYHQFTFAP